MEKKMSAKDIAFEKERAKYRKQINELNRELSEQKKEDRNLLECKAKRSMDHAAVDPYGIFGLRYEKFSRKG